MEQPPQGPTCPELEEKRTALNADYIHTPQSELQWQEFMRLTRCLGGEACSGPTGWLKRKCGNQLAAAVEFERRQSISETPSDDES